MTGQIVLMKTLHNQYDYAILLIVEAREQRRSVIIIDLIASCARKSLIGFQRVVDDDEIPAATGQRAADRNRDTTTALRRFELSIGISLRPSCRKDPLIPAAIHDLAKSTRELRRQRLRVAEDDDARMWVMTQQKGWKRNRCAQRL